MPLSLYVDGERWRSHLRATVEAEPALVPVTKGNGYGFGLPRLARRAQWLGVDTIALGQYDEIPAVESRFDGSLLVLTPYRDFHATRSGAPLSGALGRRVIHTIGRAEDLRDLLRRTDLPRSGPRVVLELLTSMRRHGFTAAELRDAVATASGSVQVEGVAMHLPLNTGDHLGEVERRMTDVVAADLESNVVWVSHLTADELSRLRAAWPDYAFRPRVGTDLWLGDRGALRVRATVLDSHPVQRGERYGYRERTAQRRGTILVLSGGTAHGIGLEAPTGDSSLRAKAGSLARGGLDAAGQVRSPFTVAGKARLFAEPPHMQASMLFLPGGVTPPEIGEEVDVRVRFTATTFDRVVLD